MPSRKACDRKSGEVSMTTLRPPAESRIEHRVRRSRGFSEWQTEQLHPSVGTPMDVPEPRTVRRSAFIPSALSADAFLALRRGGCRRLGHFEKGHFEAADHLEQQVLLFLGKVAEGFIAQRVEHVDHLARTL